MDHFAVDDIVLRASVCPIALSLQHSEVVAVKRGVRIGFHGVPFGGCKRSEWSQRTLRLTFGRLPVQAVLLAGITNELHRVLLRGFAIVKLRKVLLLSAGHGLASLNDCQFIPANPAT